MSIVLKIVAALYLAAIWWVFALTTQVPASAYPGTYNVATIKVATLLITIGLSIPAVLIYAFAQIVADVRAMRGHLRAMQRYYEPHQ